MRLIAITLALLASVCISRPLCAEDAPKRSAELQVLDRFIGDWETTVTLKTTGEKFNTLQSRKWSKEGKFVLSEDLNLTSKKEAHFLLTYDENAKLYRTCYIEEVNAVILLGTWDEKSQTMSWTAADPNGVKSTGANRFIDKDHVEWSLVVTGPDGKILAEMSGKQARRKK